MSAGSFDLKLYSTASVTEGSVSKDPASWKYQCRLWLEDPSERLSREDSQGRLDPAVLGIALVADRKRTKAQSFNLRSEAKSWDDIVSDYAQQVTDALNKNIGISKIEHSHLKTPGANSGTSRISVSFNSTDKKYLDTLPDDEFKLLGRLIGMASIALLTTSINSVGFGAALEQSATSAIRDRLFTDADKPVFGRFKQNHSFGAIMQAVNLAVPSLIRLRGMEEEYALD